MDAACGNQTPEPGRVLLELLGLLGWRVDARMGPPVELVAKRPRDGHHPLELRVEGDSLASAAWRLFELAVLDRAEDEDEAAAA